MKNTRNIDPSLKKKITQNDERVKVLYDIELSSRPKQRNKTPATRQKNIRREQKKRQNKDDSYAKVNLKIYNNERHYLNDDFEPKMSRTIDRREKEAKFMSRMRKRMKFKADKEEKKNNTIFNNTFSNVYKKLEDRKQKTMQKDEIDEFVNRLYHNDYKHKKNAYKENEDKNNKNEGEAADFIIRLEEDQKKRNENLENLKNELENNERQVCTYKPEMCKGSKKYNEAISNDFFERQKKYTEKINEKDEKLKEILKKREEDEIKENNILLQRKEEEKKKKKKKPKKKNENENENEGEKEGESKKDDKEDRIKGLFEWDKERKKKLEDKQKENTEKIESEYNYVPKINHRSHALAENNKIRQKEPNVFERLAKTDLLLKGKRQILIDMYTPTFQPRNYVPRNMDLDKLKKRNNNEKEEEEEEEEDEDEKKHKKHKKHKKKEKKKKDSEDEDEDEEEEDEQDEENEEDEEDEDEDEEVKNNDGFDFKQNTMKFAEDDVQDALRNSLFNKRKPKRKKSN